MTGLPQVAVRLHPVLAERREPPVVRDLLTAELTRIATSMSVPGPPRTIVEVEVDADVDRAGFSFDGTPVAPPPDLIARATSSVPGTGDDLSAEAIDEYLLVMVSGLILLNRPRPLVGTSPAPPTLHIAEALALGLEPDGTTLAGVVGSAWADLGLPSAAVLMKAETGLPPGLARWSLGGVPMPPFRPRPDGGFDAVRRAFETDVRWFGELLLDDRTVETRLDDLAVPVPDLAAAARARVSPEAMAHLLRMLAVDGIPLIHFAPIVEQAVEAKLEGVPDEHLTDRVRRGISRFVSAAADRTTSGSRRPSRPDR